MNHDHDQNDSDGQSGMDSETERRNRENETGQTSQTPQTGQQSQTPAEPEGETSFVGSGGDKSSDYLTKGENQDFQPEGQGATDTNAGTSDIETGQSSNQDSTLDDGSDTNQ